MSLNLLSIMEGTKSFGNGFEVSDMLLVCALGVGIVFFGLICIVVLCSIMSAIFKRFSKNEEKSETAVASAPAAVPAVQEPIANKQEFIAAVSAAIAEEMGTDISAIRIKSIKRI